MVDDDMLRRLLLATAAGMGLCAGALLVGLRGCEESHVYVD
jgi:hypothetical protein